MKFLVAAIIAATLTGCLAAGTGAISGVADSPLVAIKAGEARFESAGDRWLVWYFVDGRTQTCWIKLGDAGSPMDCCKLRRVPEATPLISWETDATCAPPVAWAPQPSPPTAATPPATAPGQP